MKHKLFDKIFEEVCKSDGSIDGDCKATKAIESLAIEAQIDLLEKQNERLEKQKKSLEETLDFVMRTRSDMINGKIEGIKLAIENNRQEIQELKRQLA